MPDYHPYWEGAGPDLYEKYTVEQNAIHSWVKKPYLLKFLEKWEKNSAFYFTPKTKIVDYRNESGKGWVELDGLDGAFNKYTFYSYENVDCLLDEVKTKGIPIVPDFPETFAKRNM